MRNPLIDLLKGVAIVLVVVGHATQWFSNYDTSHWLFVSIYAFHMPLFMFLSGFVNFSAKGEINIRKRFQTLVIPFFSWFIISQLAYKKPTSVGAFLDNFHLLLRDPTTGRWFLWILFFLCLLLFISLKISKLYTEWVLIGFLWLIVVLSNKFVKERIFYGIFEIKWYFLFFIMGYIFHKYHEKLYPFVKKIGFVSLFVFPFLVFITEVSGKPSFLENVQLADNQKYSIYGLHLYLSAISGIFATYFVFDKFKNYDTKLKSGLIFLGGISLEIYLTHFHFHFITRFLKNYFPNLLYINILVFTFLAILGSYYAQKLLKKSSFLAKILYGKF